MLEPSVNELQEHTTRASNSRVVTGAKGSTGRAGEESGCPAPLSWQEVLAVVRQGSEPVVAETPLGPIRGRAFGSGRPLVCLNGCVGDHESFVLLAWLLRDDCRCLRLDYPDLPTARSSSAETLLRLLAEAVGALADSCGMDRVSLYGTAFGTLVALQLMLQRPRLVDGTALHCAFAYRRFSFLERWLIRCGQQRRGTLEDVPVATRLLQHNHLRWFPPFDVTRWSFYQQQEASTPIAQLARRAWVSEKCDLRVRLGEIDIPTLLIQCEGDGREAAKDQSELARRLRQVQQESLDNTGRLVHLTHPHRLVKVLMPFLIESTSERP